MRHNSYQHSFRPVLQKQTGDRPFQPGATSYDLKDKLSRRKIFHMEVSTSPMIPIVVVKNNKICNSRIIEGQHH